MSIYIISTLKPITLYIQQRTVYTNIYIYIKNRTGAESSAPRLAEQCLNLARILVFIGDIQFFECI